MAWNCKRKKGQKSPIGNHRRRTSGVEGEKTGREDSTCVGAGVDLKKSWMERGLQFEAALTAFRKLIELKWPQPLLSAASAVGPIRAEMSLDWLASYKHRPWSDAATWDLGSAFDTNIRFSHMQHTVIFPFDHRATSCHCRC